MRSGIIVQAVLFGSLTAGLVGCASRQAPPLRYVALEMPTEIQPRKVIGRRVASDIYKKGVVTAAPDLVRALEDLAKAEGSDVLMFVRADVTKSTDCLTICFQVSAARTEESRAAAAVRVPAMPKVPEAMALKGGSTAVAVGQAALLDRPLLTGLALKTLLPGEELALVRKMSNTAGHWWYVRADGKEGWVLASQLAPPGK